MTITDYQTTGEITELELRSDEAEKSVIGAAVFNAKLLSGVIARLPGADFYSEHRGHVWDAIRYLAGRGEWIAPTTVAPRLQELGLWNAATEAVVATDMLTSQPWEYAGRYATTIHAFARKRELLRTVNRARNIVTGHPGDPDEIAVAVRAALAPIDGDEVETGRAKTWQQMAAEFHDFHTSEHPPGIPTPWWELDELIGGLHAGRMYVIGGSPGDGKSSVALGMALAAAFEGKQVLAYSAEMPAIEVFGRLVSRGADVDLGSIGRAQLSPAQIQRIDDYANANRDLPIRVNADNATLSMIEEQARDHKQRRGLDLLVVDYLQLIGTDKAGRSAEEEIARISTALKKLARRLDCAVVLPAQLNRNPASRADRKPTKSDLRGSGKIEQDSDVVILLWREPMPDGNPNSFEVKFLIDKNRQGPRGEITLGWRGSYGTVESLAEKPAS